jgi:hypothetical protein
MQVWYFEMGHYHFVPNPYTSVQWRHYVTRSNAITSASDWASLHNLGSKLLNEISICEECCLVGCDAVSSDRSSQMFRTNLLPPSSGPKSESSSRKWAELSGVPILDYTASYPENSSLHSRRCDNFKFNNMYIYTNFYFTPKYIFKHSEDY